jgi:hypothetical protein
MPVPVTVGATAESDWNHSTAVLGAEVRPVTVTAPPQGSATTDVRRPGMARGYERAVHGVFMRGASVHVCCCEANHSALGG